MDAISHEVAKEKLDETLDAVCKNHTPVVITRPFEEAVVLMSLSDFNSLRETEYLLGNPENAAHLRHSIAEAESGKLTTVSVDDL